MTGAIRDRHHRVNLLLIPEDSYSKLSAMVDAEIIKTSIDRIIEMCESSISYIEITKKLMFEGTGCRDNVFCFTKI